MIKNISDFVSKQKMGRSIEGVLVTPNKIVASDSFKLIEIKAETGAGDSYIVPLPKGLKTFEKVEKVGTGANVYHKGAKYEVAKTIDGIFPEYEKLIPVEKPVFEILLSPEHLGAITKAFEETIDGVKLSFYGESKVVLFTNKKNNLRALLMPMNK